MFEFEKRFVALVLTILMVLSVMPANVLATGEDMTLVVSSDKSSVGAEESFVVTVSVGTVTNAGFGTISFVVSYDTTRFTYNT